MAEQGARAHDRHRPHRRRRQRASASAAACPSNIARSAASRCCAGRSSRCSRHPAVDAVRVVIGDGPGGAGARRRSAGSTSARSSSAAPSARIRSAPGSRAIDGDAVLVHDAARPFCPPAVIDRLLAALEFFDGAAPVLPVGDTLARAGDQLGEPVDRDRPGPRPDPAGLPPRRACARPMPRWSGDAPTDETTVLRAAGHDGRGGRRRSGARQADHRRRLRRAPRQWLAGRLVPRTGMGFDVHAFAGEGPIMLGGIAVPHDRGLAGHSDADVVLHAITDALLGAAGARRHRRAFPAVRPAVERRGVRPLPRAMPPRLLRVDGRDHRPCRLHGHRRGAEGRPASRRDARTDRRNPRPDASTRSASRRRRPKGSASPAAAKALPPRRSPASGWDAMT